MRRRLRQFAVIALSATLATPAVAAFGSEGGRDVMSGWWWTHQQEAAALPTVGVATNEIAVGKTLGSGDRFAAVWFDTADLVSTPTAVELHLKESYSTLAPQFGNHVVACLVSLNSPMWAEDHGGRNGPGGDCQNFMTTGHRLDDGTWVFDVTGAVNVWVNGLSVNGAVVDYPNKGLVLAPAGSAPDHQLNFLRPNGSAVVIDNTAQGPALPEDDRSEAEQTIARAGVDPGFVPLPEDEEEPPEEDPGTEEPPAGDPPAEDDDPLAPVTDLVAAEEEPPEEDPGTEEPPADDPPAEDDDPLAPVTGLLGGEEEPPEDDPGTEEPPADDPPADDPPADDPPAEDDDPLAPATGLLGGGDEPPADDPPADDPPAEDGDPLAPVTGLLGGGSDSGDDTEEPAPDEGSDDEPEDGGSDGSDDEGSVSPLDGALGLLGLAGDEEGTDPETDDPETTDPGSSDPGDGSTDPGTGSGTGGSTGTDTGATSGTRPPTSVTKGVQVTSAMGSTSPAGRAGTRRAATTPAVRVADTVVDGLADRALSVPGPSDGGTPISKGLELAAPVLSTPVSAPDQSNGRLAAVAAAFGAAVAASLEIARRKGLLGRR